MWEADVPFRRLPGYASVPGPGSVSLATALCGTPSNSCHDDHDDLLFSTLTPCPQQLQVTLFRLTFKSLPAFYLFCDVFQLAFHKCMLLPALAGLRPGAEAPGFSLASLCPCVGLMLLRRKAFLKKTK